MTYELQAAVDVPTIHDHEKPSPQTLLLWDLDNVTCRKSRLTELAQTLTVLAGPDALLAAAGRRHLYRALREPLTDLGFTVLSGGRRTNGADRALLRYARTIHTRKRTLKFVVASNDHAFACLPQGQVTVITQQPGHLSRRLRATANEVIVLDLGKDHWVVAATLAVGSVPSGACRWSVRGTGQAPSSERHREGGGYPSTFSTSLIKG